MAEQTIDFCLPSLGADMEEGTIIVWHVAVGDVVERGDIVLAVETEKGDIDVEIWESGTISEICIPPGETVPVGTVIARIARGDAAAPPSPPRPPQPAQAPIAGAASSEPLVAAPAGRTPPDATVSQDTLRPLGPVAPVVSPRLVYWPSPSHPPGDATGRHDVRAFEPQPTIGTDLDPIRGAIARRVARSNREIPHYHVMHEIGLGRARDWLDSHNDGRPPGERVVMAALLVHAVATAARAVPELNGHWTERGPTLAERVDVGVIIRLRSGGIVTPILPEADTLTVDETMSGLVDLTTRARAGRLRGSDLAEPSLTVTNLGDRGVEAVFGVIQPPQLALVGFGRVEERPTVTDGQVTITPAVTSTLSGDHRATDGLTGAKFLHAVDRTLQEDRS